MSENRPPEGLTELDYTRQEARERLKRRREWLVIALLAGFFIALTVGELRLTRISANLPFTNSIFFFALLNINIVILVALMWLVFRNIGKMFIERRRRVLGARLKTKLVLAFLAFSITPTLLLFAISAMYINSSFEKWFSIKIQNTLQASLEITDTYYRNANQSAMHFAEHIASNIGRRLSQESAQEFPMLEPPAWIDAYLASQRELLAIDAVEFYPDILDRRIISQRAFPGESEVLFQRYAQDLLVRAYSGEKVSVTQHVGSGDLIRTLVPVHLNGGTHGLASAGIVSVGMYIPVSLVNKVDEIANVFDDYKDVNPLKYPMKTTYFIILIMITLVIIFVAIWIGLYMARELTVPVERLVYGAQAVGGGNLDVTISGSGHDEIAVLVESFNKMTRDLRENRERLIQASSDIEKRQRELEAILANVGTGVLAVDRDGRITTVNRAASHLFEVQASDWVGKHYSKVLVADREALRELIDRAFWVSERDRSQHAETSQWNTSSAEHPRSLAAISTPLFAGESAPESAGSFLGIVVVIDDLTHIVKAQRETAWREVARRIAHEIKNPLTPIKLSAQRLQRRMGDYSGKDSQLLKECTDTIIQHTDELKEMVNEFSSFARFPEISPSLSDLNGVLKEVVSLFSSAHPEIQMKVDLEGKLPPFEFDRDQIKRVVINLLDNAVAALGAKAAVSESKRIRLATHFNEQLGIAAIEVEDNGVGMSEDVKARVFEPYFSTKKEGTGLGLAIVKRIINDHDGFIRVYSAPDKGTQFLIELPLGPKKRPQRHDDRPAV